MPERPAGPQTAWSNDCYACLVHISATLNSVEQMRQMPIEYRPDATRKVYTVRLADSVALEAERLDNPIIAGLARSYGGDAERVRKLIEA